jgi:hypothetical protein
MKLPTGAVHGAQYSLQSTTSYAAASSPTWTSSAYQDEEPRRSTRASTGDARMSVPCSMTARRLSLVISFHPPPTLNTPNDEQSEHSTVSPRSLLIVCQLLTLHSEGFLLSESQERLFPLRCLLYTDSWWSTTDLNCDHLPNVGRFGKHPGKCYVKLFVDKDVKKTAVAERGDTASWNESFYLCVEFQCYFLHTILNQYPATICMNLPY